MPRAVDRVGVGPAPEPASNPNREVVMGYYQSTDPRLQDAEDAEHANTRLVALAGYLYGEATSDVFDCFTGREERCDDCPACIARATYVDLCAEH